jgi:ubiquinone/menaquinone biosynthesis C-methylase UbiE
MPRADYEGWMAGAYDAGRALTPAAVRAWRDAARPFLLHEGGTSRVLDLGAGTGRFSAYLADWSCGPVVAIEPALAMARQAKDKDLANVDVVNGRAESIPVRDHSVRAAWLSNVIHHFDNLDAAASELHRVLQPDGRVLLRGTLGLEGMTCPGSADARILHYFPGARKYVETFPTRRDVLDSFGRAHFTEDATMTVSQVTATCLRAFYERIRTRAHSQLAKLDDHAFEAGLSALERDAALETSPTPVMDDVDLVVLRTTKD